MKTAIVTGAGRGIGTAVSRMLAGSGWEIIEVDRDFHGLRNEAQYTADIAQPPTPVSFRGLGEFVTIAGGKIDLLINNAAVCRMDSIADATDTDILDTINSNLTGLIRFTKACLPYLADGARIVNVSSGAALYGLPDNSVYAATKRAVEALTEAWDIELRPRGIRCCFIRFPNVDTDMIAPYKDHPIVSGFDRHLTAEQAAKALFKAATGPFKLRHNASWWLKIIAVVTHHFPSVARWLVRRNSYYR